MNRPIKTFFIFVFLCVVSGSAYSQPRYQVSQNQVSAAWLHSKMPTKPVVITTDATLCDYYNFGYAGAKATHYSIRLDGRGNDYGTGYVPRKSADGKALFNVLKDGRPHQVTVAVSYDSRSQGDGSVFNIVKVIGIR